MNVMTVARNSRNVSEKPVSYGRVVDSGGIPYAGGSLSTRMFYLIHFICSFC